MQSFTVQVAQRGLVTLPKEVRKAHNIEPGQQMTLLDLDGVFVLSLQPSQVDALADRIAEESGGPGRDAWHPCSRRSTKCERNMPEARVFLDTSALFAAVLSPTGGARAILKLGESGAIQRLGRAGRIAGGR